MRDNTKKRGFYADGARRETMTRDTETRETAKLTISNCYKSRYSLYSEYEDESEVELKLRLRLRLI
jgi:hypothetical protein